ncbi:MAG: hypothetical protein HYV54_02580 [Parcubacteria group bacterium]|nr:hypothetical protein [Parcubacteria group bacterium]
MKTLDQKGIALLITMVLLGTVMATAMGIAVLVTGETGITRLVTDSTLAIFAADAGMEKMFYACSNKIPYPSPANFTVLDIGNGARYDVCMADASGGSCTNDCNNAWVSGKGTYRSAQRSLEASY